MLCFQPLVFLKRLRHFLRYRFNQVCIFYRGHYDYGRVYAPSQLFSSSGYLTHDRGHGRDHVFRVLHAHDPQDVTSWDSTTGKVLTLFTDLI